MNKNIIDYENELKSYMEVFLANNILRIHVDAQDQNQAMVLSVGGTTKPIAMSIALFRPAKVLFLVSAMSEKVAEAIVLVSQDQSEYPVRLTLNENCFLCLVDQLTSVELYNEIKKFYKENNRTRLLIDFTGGTKPMSAACFMASTGLDAKLVYVGSDDDNKDGTENIVFVKNPQEYTASYIRNRALEVYASGQFSQARAQYEMIKDSTVSELVQKEKGFVISLCCVYEKLEKLDFVAANEKFEESIWRWAEYSSLYAILREDSKEELKDPHVRLQHLSLLLGILKENMKKDNFKPEFTKAIVGLLISLAKRQNSLGHYDLAVLYLYRLTEYLARYQLALHNIKLSDDEKGLSKCLSKLSNQDEIFSSRQLKDQIIVCANRRNQSVLAHGFLTLESKDYSRFFQLIDEYILRNFLDECQISREDFNKEYIKPFKCIYLKKICEDS